MTKQELIEKLDRQYSNPDIDIKEWIENAYDEIVTKERDRIYAYMEDYIKDNFRIDDDIPMLTDLSNIIFDRECES